MQADRLQDLVRRAYGRAAVAVGDWCHAYRPAGATDPLNARDRFMLLQAAFTSPRPDGDRPVGYGMATWWGVFDAAYTQAGDYIVRDAPGDGAVWFIAAQQPYLPILCVRADRVVNFNRPAALTNPGVSGYGGYTRADAEPLLSGFPASVLNAGTAGLNTTDLPSDVIPQSWQVLLPATGDAVLRSGDLMRDDLGRNGVVASAELTGLGWRLLVRQATT